MIVLNETVGQKRERLVQERCQKVSGQNEAECLFCGSSLHHVTRTIFDRIISIGFEPCSCNEYQNSLKCIENEILDDERKQIDFEQTRKINELFRNCGMGERFKQRTFSTYKAIGRGQIVAINAALNFVEEFKSNRKARGLFLCGSVGTGKTHLAAAVTHELIRMTVPVLFGTATALLTRIKDGWQDDSDKAAIDALCKVPLLVIDDLGKEYARRNSDGWSWVHEQLYHVINRRYEDYLPMVITTNLNLAELNNKLDISIVSRIVESCRGVEFDWEDYRFGGNET